MSEIRMSKKKKFDYIDVVAHILMILFSLCILYPMLHVLAVSFSGAVPILKNKVSAMTRHTQISKTDSSL